MNQNITGNELELYKSFYNTYPDAVLILQEERTIACNELTHRLFKVDDGYKIINKKLSDFSQKEADNLELVDHLTKCLVKGKDTFSWYFQNTKGEQINAKVFLSTIEIDKKILVQAILRNDTVKNTKQNQEQQLKAITVALDQSAIISIADTEGKIIKVNEEFCKVSQYSEKELLGKDHNIVNSAYHPKEFWQDMWRTIARGKTWRADVKNKAKDGSFYWMDTVINPMLDNNGKIMSYLSIRYLITDRKKIEFELQTRQEQLQTTEEELRQNIEELEAQRDYIQEVNNEIKAKSDISDRNNHALLELNKSKDIYTGNLGIAFEEITKKVANILNIERVGIWKYDTTNETKITAQKQYETTEEGYIFTKGTEIKQKDTPKYFEDILAEKNIVADFAQNHPALVEFVDGYLTPLGIKSMLDVPYFLVGELAGVICCEAQNTYRNWTHEDITFVKGVSDIITIAIETEQKIKEQEKVKQNFEKFQATQEAMREKQALIEESKIALEKQNQKLASNEAVLKKAFEKMKLQKLQLIESINSLQTQEEELRQNMEELEATQEAMAQKQKLIEESKIALEKQNEKLASNEAVLKKAFEKMKQQDIKLRESFDALQTQDEELRQNMEELQTTQEVMAYQKDVLEISNRQITKSISYAKTIQNAFLPSNTQMKALLPESFVIYKPKDIVSGDFYWLSEHENKILVGVIDCTGHGVPGAFMSLVGSNILSEVINQNGYLQPNLILQELHKGVVKKLNQKEGANNDGMDLTLCLIEKKSNNQTLLTFGGVKQNLYIVRGKELIELKGNRRSIGGGKRDDKRDYMQEEIILQKDDSVFLATDGYADQANKERKSFSKNAFRNLMVEVGHLPAKEQMKIFEKRLASHQKDTEQRDDITVLGFKI